MSGPFVATIEIGAPFKIKSEPYTIEGPAVEPQTAPKRNIWMGIIAVSVLIAGLIVLIVRKFQAP